MHFSNDLQIAKSSSMIMKIKECFDSERTAIPKKGRERKNCFATLVKKTTCSSVSFGMRVKCIAAMPRCRFTPKIELFVSQRLYFFPCLDINRYRQSVSAVCDPRAVLKHFYFFDGSKNSRLIYSCTLNCPIFLDVYFTKSKHSDKYIEPRVIPAFIIIFDH